MKSAGLWLMLMTAGLLPGIASATLGAAETSVQGDGQQMKGTIKSMAYSGYRVHEIELPSGTVVREFVNADGIVFAVAWSGRSVPNLSQTLGTYFTTYVTEAKTNTSRHHFAVRHADFIAESTGHMRHFVGRAYLPQAVPAGVSLEDLH